MSSIQSVKASINWVAPNKRPACRNCVQVDERGNPQAPSWYCKAADFLTSAYAICDKHQWMHGNGRASKGVFVGAAN